MTGWFSAAPTALAMMRATRSLAPPAVNGATKVMGLSGQAARAGALNESAAEQASAMLAANRTEVRNMESGLQEVGRAVAAAGPPAHGVGMTRGPRLRERGRPV